MSKHLELVRAVNSATTEREHDLAQARLRGWREGVEHCGRKWDFIAADEDTEEIYPGRPYCCGVLLDWTPAPKFANWRTQMDDELKELAALALRNAFWHDFSALANKYLEAAKGLDTDSQEMQMGEMTSFYGRATDEDATDVTLNIWTQNGESKFATTGHDTILEALEHEPATEVHLRGKKVFERRDGEWYFTGD